MAQHILVDGHVHFLLRIGEKRIRILGLVTATHVDVSCATADCELLYVQVVV